MQLDPRNSSARPQKPVLGAALALGLLAAPSLAHAQSAIIYGSVSNFDISNDTGLVCHGFEIDIDGQTTLLPDTAHFSANRYGTPKSIAYNGGVAVRWEAPYDPVTQTFADRTIQHTVPWFPGQCYQWNPATYQDSGCEHFGTARVGASTNVTAMTGRWLCEDPFDPAVLQPIDPPTSVPFPNYYVQPPAQVGQPAQVVIVIPPPLPPAAPVVYGDAVWMRVFVTEKDREVNLNELLADNPGVVPMDAAQLESNWDLVQADPPGLPPGRHSQKRNGRDLSATTRSVVRRIETWAYAGAYDPVSHIALCADGTCTTPAAGEVGALLNTQMTAVNVQADTLTVTKRGTGSGNVDSTDKRISCGNKCVAPYNAGTMVTLTVKASSGSVFTGWTGACSGTATTCTVPVNGHTEAIATFAPQASGGGGGGGGGGGSGGATLSVKTSGGKGVITSSPAGINCGGTCSATVVPGTSVTLSVVPDAGFRFVSWSGACVGTAATCTLTVNGAASVQANLTK